MGFLQSLSHIANRYRIGIIAVTMMYIISLVGQSFLGWTSIRAESALSSHRLVAVIVHESLMEPLRQDLDRYTRSYIPSRMDNALPLIITYHDTHTPRDIVTILENLYFEGMVDTPSTLEGIVVIGNVPLPTVYDQETTYDSVFPYVDFKDPAYSWNPTTKRFEGNTTTLTHPHADIWHGLMTRGNNPSVYRHFFAKLRRYVDNPGSFATKRIWMDDFSNLSSYLNPDKIHYYLQQSIHAEDLSYHRYTPLLLSLLQSSHNDLIKNTLGNFASLKPLPTAGDYSDEFVNSLNAYTKVLKKTLTKGSDKLNSLDDKPVPTILLQRMIDEFIVSYPELLSKKYRSDLQKYIEASGRRKMDDVDNHTKKLFGLDMKTQGSSSYNSIITKANTTLENLLIQKVKDNQYAVPYPLLTQVDRGNHRIHRWSVTTGTGKDRSITRHSKRICMPQYTWQAMYHGMNGAVVSSIDDILLYKGTFGNQSTLKTSNTHNHPLSSVGSSYGINNTQVESNRGHNIVEMGDTDLIKSHKSVDGRCNISVKDFIKHYRGGNTMMNLDGANFRLKDNNPQHARQPIPSYISSVGSLIDIAGSRKTTKHHTAYNSFLAAQSPSIQQTRYGGGSIPYCSSTRWSRQNGSATFWNIRPSFASITVNGRNSKWLRNNKRRETYNGCEKSSRHYSYKLIDSTVINRGPLPQDIKKMNITTMNRPIDSDHSITFQGLTRDMVRFVMPNIRDTTVFAGESNGDTQASRLLDVDTIASNIKTLLRSSIREYNTTLQAQNSRSHAIYHNNHMAYNFLGSIDARASANRTYKLLDEDLLIKALGEGAIDTLAQTLWRQNLPRSYIDRSTTVHKDIAQLMTGASIDRKIAHVMNTYIHENQTDYLPGYHSPGYESIALHANKNHTLVSTASPTNSNISSIRNRRNRALRNIKNGIYADTTISESDNNHRKEVEICGVSPGEAVPLVGQWIKAFNCRLQQTIKKPFDISITFPSLDLEDLGSDFVDSWNNFSTSRDTYNKQRQSTEQSTQDMLSITASESTTNDKTLTDAPQNIRSSLRSQYYDSSIERHASSVSIDNLDEASLSITTPKLLEGYSVSLTATGANCPFMGANNLCTSSNSIDAAGGSVVAPIHFSDLTAGGVVVQLNLCHTASKTCVTRSSMIQLTPGALAKATITTPTNSVATAGRIPLTIAAVDQGNNALSTLINPLVLSTKKGVLIQGGNPYNTLEVNRPHDGVFWYEGSSKSNIVFDTVSISGTIGDKEEMLDTASIVTTPYTEKISVGHKGTTGSSVDVPLSSVYRADGSIHYPRVTFSLRDDKNKPLSHHIVSLATNPLFAHLIDEKGKPITHTTTDKNGTITAQVVPHMKLTTSEIRAQILGHDTFSTVSVNRRAGDPHIITLRNVPESLAPDESASISVSATDKWGNPLTTPTAITLTASGPLGIGDQKTTRTTVKIGDTITLHGLGNGTASIIASLPGVSMDQQLPDAHTISVSHELISLRSLNGVTAYLDGQGRGSWNTPQGSSRLREAFLTSSKLLAISTTLMPHSKVGSGSYGIPWSYDSLPGKHLGGAFVDDMTALTDWAQGSRRGEAHLPYSNPLTVIYGDPFLGHIGDNPSSKTHTTARGERIATIPGKSIKKVHPFDLNDDNLEDLLIEYTDGSLYLLKNYGGSTDPYVNMGLLMIADGGIKHVEIGDVDGNGYEDIIIQSKNSIRAYPNIQGVIDVDGFPVCLDLPGGPDAYDTVHQFFMRDMDLDGSVDIITNDTHGTVRITYGGKNKPYLSRDRITCDSGRKTRSAKDSLVVTSFALELTNDPVRDGSIIHRKGLTYTPGESATSGFSPPSANTMKNIVSRDGSVNQSALNQLIKGQASANIDNVVADGVGNAYRYIASPFRFVPGYYGSDMTYRDMYYVPAYSQRNTDPITIEKTYNDLNGDALLPGDKVRVTVTATARMDTTITYMDYGRGARDVDTYTTFDNANYLGPIIKTMDRSGLDGNYVYKGQPGGQDYLYMLDNLTFAKNQTRQRSYEVTYRGGPLTDVSIRLQNEDEYPDIIMFPSDTCNQTRREWLNTTPKKHRSYATNITDLSKPQKKAIKDREKNNSKDVNKFTDNISEVATGKKKISQLDALKAVGEKRSKDFVHDLLNNGSVNQIQSLNLDIAIDPEIMNAYNNVTEGLCKGFSLGSGCGGLPVPFNMAFLAPGDLQVMGCKIFDDQGLPSFFFPGTLYTPPPVPIPYGQTGPGDSFYRAKGGTYPSMIRLYTAPTLTQQLGVAICVGPMSAGTSIPAPFKNITGNCIVAAAGLPSDCDDKTDTSIRPDGANSLTNDWRDIGSRGSCTSPSVQLNQSLPPEKRNTISPFKQSSRSTSGTPVPPSINLGGMVMLDSKPNFNDIGSTNLTPGMVSLEVGQDTKNKIKGGNGGGLAQCLIQGWLDPQITYIANNLTTLNFTLYLPDLQSLTQGMDTLNKERIKTIFKENKQHTYTTPTKKNHQTQQAERMALTRASIEQRDEKLQINNPFEKVRELFEEVPLINITTQKTPIHIPMITQDELLAYEVYIKERVDYHKTIIKDIKNLVNSTIGICGKAAGMDVAKLGSEALKQKRSDIIKKLREQGTKEAQSCLSIMVDGKLPKLITMEQDMTQVMQKVQENMQAINTYKRFPQELAALIQSVDRYVVDAAAFVQTFFSKINTRLGTNARIFNGYVDAIINIKVAIETRQALIDLSVNRKQSCSSCSNDNYGAYSCSLKFMCPSLPLLKIPPMKIPDIYVDLSHIDASVDLVLPEIAFVHTPVELPQLPKLPQMPRLNVDFTLTDAVSLAVDIGELEAKLPNIPSIPDIPVLPPAPTLPKLPAIIPNISLELPYLPPPPEIPALASSIKQMINIGEKIGKLFCIMKGEIGIVGEKGVKSKIEQLTQRTWNVPIFDYFNLTHLHDSPTLEGLDFRLSSYIDFTMNISAVFDVVNGLAKQSNTVVSQLQNSVSAGMREAQHKTQQKLDNTVPSSIKFQGYERTTDREDMRQAISLIQDTNRVDTSSLDKLERMIDRYSTKTASYDMTHITNAQQDIVDDMTNYRRQLTDITTTIDPDSLDSLIALVDMKPRIASHAVIASMDMSGYDDMKTINPARDYLTKQHEIMSNYRTVLDNADAASLQLGERTYNNVRHSVNQTYAMLDKTLKPDSRPSFSPAQSRVAQAGGGSAGSSSTFAYNLGQYLKGTYRTQGTGSYDVIESDLREDAIQGYIQTDINNDTADDLVIRDTQSIYIKYANQNSDHKPHTRHGHEGEVLRVDLGRKLDAFDDKGSITVDGVRLRVWHPYFAVSGLETSGQSYDTISLSRLDSSLLGRKPDGYMIRLSQRIDRHHDADHESAIPDDAGAIFVLVLPQGTVEVPDLVRLSHDSGYERTQSLIDSDRLHVVYAPFMTERISVTIDKLPRYRHYAQVAQLQSFLDENNKNSDPIERMIPVSNWGSQVVAGPQVIADDDGPTPSVTLIRERLDNSVIDDGLNLNGYIGTYYTLHIEREDPSGVDTSWIMSGSNASRFSGSTVTKSGLFFTEPGTYKFPIGATDTQNNNAERLITLIIESPEISIKDVQHNNTTGVVIGELSHDIDEGLVDFGRVQQGQFALMSGTNGAHFSTTTKQTIITGGIYSIGDTVGLYTKDNTYIGSVDPHNGHIQTLSDDYIIKGQRHNHTLRWSVIDTTNNNMPLFSIGFPVKEIINRDILDNSYKRQAIDIGGYTGCIVKKKSCIVASDAKGNLVIPAPYNYDYHATYRYNKRDSSITTTIIHTSTNKAIGYSTNIVTDLLAP